MKKAIAVLFGVLLCCNAWAQEKQEKYDIGEVIVTATKTEERTEEVGSSFNVITSSDIKEQGKKMVSDVLRDIPGVTVVQSGPIGSLTDIYLRGVNPGQTLVLIDGVEVNDPMAPTRGFDFAHLTVEDIEKIEIIRGPQSTLYGSDAIGGVINIITKKGEGKPTLLISAEGGSYTTFRESISLSGATATAAQKIDYAATVTRIDSEGFSTAKDGSEEDGYYNTTASLRAGANIFDACRLSGVIRYTDAKSDLDDGSFLDDPNYWGKWRNLATRAEFDQQIFPWWDHNLSCSYSETKRIYRDKINTAIDLFGDTNSWYKGNNIEAEWQNNFYIKDIDIITAGIEYERERGSSFYRSGGLISEFPRESMETWGIFVQNLLKLWERLFITAGVRSDDNSEFGRDTNYRLACSYIHKETNTQAKASFGTGFKAPTLFQLYSIYGDPNLDPEESTGYDIGVVQKLFNDKISLGITYFHNRLKNLIDWEAAISKYNNIGRAITRGVETEVFYHPWDVLAIGLNYTYMETEDRDTGLELLRRPKNKASLNVNWKFLGKGNLNLIVRYVGKREDMDFVNFSRIDLDQYFLVDLYCSYDINDNIQVYGRVDNLFDEDYEEVYGFNTPGISGYLGTRIKL